jgi:hypothetical protein
MAPHINTVSTRLCCSREHVAASYHRDDFGKIDTWLFMFILSFTGKYLENSSGAARKHVFTRITNLIYIVYKEGK